MKLSELKEGAVVMDADGDVWMCGHRGLFYVCPSDPDEVEWSNVHEYGPFRLMGPGETVESEHVDD